MEEKSFFCIETPFFKSYADAFRAHFALQPTFSLLNSFTVKKKLFSILPPLPPACSTLGPTTIMPAA